MQIDRQVAQAGAEVMQERPDQTKQYQLQQGMSQMFGQIGIGLDGTQTLVKDQQQHWQSNEQKNTTSAMQDGNDTGEWQFDLVESEMLGA